jgi:hypothetical protein
MLCTQLGRERFVATAQSELAEIKRFGGTPQKNSGRGAVKKGDAILEPFLVDVKEYAKSYSVSIANWAKISSDAIKSGGYQPALNVVLGETSRVRLWVISEGMFLEMHEAWKEKYAENDEVHPAEVNGRGGEEDA